MAAKFFMNGGVNNNWSADTNWSTTSSAGPNNTTHAIAGDAVTLNAGSPACTIDSASAATSIVCTGYTNTLTFNSTLTLTSTCTFASGMTIAGTSGTLISTAVATLTSAGKTLTCALTINASSNTTLADDWTVNGLVTLCATGAVTITGNHKLNCAGGLTHSSSTLTCNTGTTSIVLKNGTFTAGGTSGGLTLEIDAGANTVTQSGTLNLGSSSKVTYTSGTFVTAGTAISVSGSTTFDTGGVTLTNLSMTSATTLTLLSNLTLSGAFNINVSGTSTVTGSFTLSCATMTWQTGSGPSLTLTDAIVSCSGLWTLNPSGTAGALTGSGTAALTADSCTVSKSGYVFTLTGINPRITNLTTVSVSTFTLNGSGLSWSTGGLTTTGSMAGTAKVVFNGTGTWTGAAGSLANSFDINTSGTLTLSGTILYLTGTGTYIAGTISGGSSILDLTGACTLDTSGMTWANVTIATTGTITLSSALNVSGTLTLPNSAATFGGSAGFSVGTLTMTSLTASRIFTFVHSQAYCISTAFNTVGTTPAIRAAFKSDSAGTKAKLTLNGAATQDVGFGDPTDIDSNNGQKIFSYQGTITTSFNWTAAAPLRVGMQAVGYAA